MLAGIARPQAPQQRRLEKRLRIERIEDGLSGQPELDLAIHLDDGLAAAFRVRIGHLAVLILRPVALEGGGVRHVAAA